MSNVAATITLHHEGLVDDPCVRPAHGRRSAAYLRTVDADENLSAVLQDFATAGAS